MKTISQSFIFAGIILALVAGVFVFSTITADAYGSSCGDCDTTPTTPSTPTGGGGGGDNSNPPSCDIRASLSVAQHGQEFLVTWSGTPASSDFWINGFKLEDANDSATYTFDGQYDYMRFTIYGENNDGDCGDEVVINKKVPGCPDPEASNYNPDANYDDHSCEYEAPAPACELFVANPTEIFVGESTTLTWKTSNATGIFINNGIGNDGGNLGVNDSFTVSPLVNTTYNLTVIGAEGANNNTSCSVPVIVKPVVVDNTPAISIIKRDAVDKDDTQQVAVGGTATFEIVVTNTGAEDLINVVVTDPIEPACQKNIGALAIGASDTYTCTTTDVRAAFTNTAFVTGDSAVDGETVTDNDPTHVTIAPVVDPEVFTCPANVVFTATDTSLTRGQSATLNWNVTNADSVSISGINASTMTGSQTVSPTSDTTYTLTASKSGFDTISCPVTINVSTGGGGGGGGSATPRCELEISTKKISAGDEIELTWTSRLATALTLTDDRGNVLVTTEGKLSDDKDELFDGTITLNPTRATTYTLLVERGSRDRECEVSVEVDDEVVLLQVRDQAPLVSGISLSQVPYTGFEAGPVMTVLFYMLLITWALYITYVLVMPKAQLAMVPVTNTRVKSNQELMQNAEQIRPDVFAAIAAAPVVSAPANLPVATSVSDMPVVAEIKDTNTIENQAHALQALISSDAARTIAEMTNESNQVEVLAKIVSDAKGMFPLEDGWVVINQSRLSQITDTTFAAMSPSPTGAGSLAEAIVTGNVVAAYELIGNRPMIALADAAADLDAVYRIRKGADATISDMLAEETKKLTEGQIAEMIAALTGALDGTYTDEASAVKMAIMKAVKVVG